MAEHYIFVERVRVIESLFTFITSSPGEECKRQLHAISAVTALCSLQESRGFRRRERFASDTKLEKEDRNPSRLNPNPPSVFSTLATRNCRQ